MKNKKIALSLPIILLLVLAGGIVYYILSNKVEVDDEGGVLTKKDAVVAQEVSYEKDGTLFKFTKNRLSKTANVEMTYSIADDEEFTDFLGTEVTMTPFFINLLCSIVNTSLFDPESLEESSDENQEEDVENVTEDAEFKNALEGYSVTEFKIGFKDKETDEQIATCQSNQKGFENIKFNATRDYSEYSSFFGHQIGVIPDNEQQE